MRADSKVEIVLLFVVVLDDIEFYCLRLLPLTLIAIIAIIACMNNKYMKTHYDMFLDKKTNLFTLIGDKRARKLPAM